MLPSSSSFLSSSPHHLSATIVIAVLGVFVMPLVYLLGLRHDISSAIANIAFGLGGIIVMAIVFGEKYFPFLKCIKSSSSKVSDETQQPSSTHSFNNLQIFSQDIIRSMNPDEQYEYYTKIIQKYTTLRLQVNSGVSTNSRVEAKSKSKYDLVEVAEGEEEHSGRPSGITSLQAHSGSQIV